MKRLYAVVNLNPEEFDHPVLCYASTSGKEELEDATPLCTELKGFAEALQGRLARDFPDCEYIVCELVPVDYDKEAL
jgi:hypothetical protein